MKTPLISPQGCQFFNEKGPEKLDRSKNNNVSFIVVSDLNCENHDPEKIHNCKFNINDKKATANANPAELPSFAISHNGI